MMRPVLFAAAVIALVAPVRAADPDLSGNWLVSYTQRGGLEQTFAIVKVEVKDGKATASTLYTPFKGLQINVTGVELVDRKTVKFNTSVGWSFEGNLEAGGKAALGSLGVDAAPNRARLTRTDKTELTPEEAIVRTTPPPAAAESQKLMTSVNQLRFQASREKDAEKRKELTEKADVAQKDVDERVPGLLREVVAKHADTPFAQDAAMDLLRSGMKFKVTPDEAKNLFAGIERSAAPYGTRYLHATAGQMLETLASQKGMETVAVGIGEGLSKAFTDNDPPAYQSQVLSAYKTALETSSVPNKDVTLKTISANLEKIEGKIDAEYLKTVPPFKPLTFAGRKDKAANQVVVMELFTGAQCPPCVAADVAFDALQKSYKPTELVLIQYHLHIPGPDPLTNSDTVARSRFYSVNSTPTTLFNGKSKAPGGGAMAGAEGKFKQYTDIIDPLLEKTTDVKITGKAHQTGEKVNLAVEVTGADGEEMKLRLLVVEETIKYVGGNQLRFHHQVVRAIPGGIDGVAIKDKSFKHAETVDLANVRKELSAYLDDFAKARP